MYLKKLIIFIFTAICSFTSLADVKEPQITNSNSFTLLSSLQKLGEGQMNILFWKVYKAEFYSVADSYNDKLYPKALKLTYLRDIKKQEFVDATKGEWDKLNSHYNERLIPLTKEKQWLNQLEGIFPNINEGDTIVLMLDENKNANFYIKEVQEKQAQPQNLQLLGNINEPEFGDYFLSIWLSKHTSQPKLRKQLIGQ